jgi:hypothetical protein
MSVIWHEGSVPSWLAPPPKFSFFEPSYIEIPAPEKYHIAQKWREFQLRDVGPDWYQWNAYWAHRFYMSKREWWQTFV